MKKLFPIMLFTLAVTGCQDNKQLQEKEAALQGARDSISTLAKQVDQLSAQIEVLKFPADQRMAEILRMIEDAKFQDAKSKIAELKECFPKSNEANQCSELLTKIYELEAAANAERERIKALGFKAIATSLSAEIDYNKVSFTAPAISARFLHDYCPQTSDKYQVDTPDRGNKFVTTSMTVTSTSKNPNLPTLAVYQVNGDKLNHLGDFTIKFASWPNIDEYLSHDKMVQNNFEKNGTVKFCLGCEVSEDCLSKPYAIVLKKSNTIPKVQGKAGILIKYNYTGDAGYPATLSLDDFSQNYQLIKIANL